MILAIDTSTQWMGIALLQDSTILYEKTWKTNRRHTVELSPSIKQAFQDTSTNVGALAGVAVALGPGSFTSLRIGLAVAKGFALSLRIPVIGVPSLDITAGGIPPQNIPLICLLRAGRGRFASMKYENIEGKWQKKGDLDVVTAEEIEKRVTTPTIICGEMTSDEKKILSRRWRNIKIAEPPQNIRRPSILANIAFERSIKDDFDENASLSPIYLRTVKNIDSGTTV